MTNLTRRRDTEAASECWLIFYGDVQVGSIGEQSGVPNEVNQWKWSCGFYPGSDVANHRHGTAATFDQARAGFEAAWRDFLPTCTEAGFQEWRYQRAHTAWKYAMWEAGCKMPTQVPSGTSRCFCGANIDNVSSIAHIRDHHMTQKGDTNG